MTDLSVKDKAILTTSGYLRHLWLTTSGSAYCDFDGDIMALTFSFYDYPVYNIFKEIFNQEIAIKITDYLNEPRIVNNSDKQFIDMGSTINILHLKPANHRERWSSDEEGELEEYINSVNPKKPKKRFIRDFTKKWERTASAIENKIRKLKGKDSHKKEVKKEKKTYRFWSKEEHSELIQHINDNSDKPTKPQDINFYANEFKRTPAAIRQKIYGLINMNETAAIRTKIYKLVKMNETERPKITKDVKKGFRDQDYVFSGPRLSHDSDSVQNENLQNQSNHQLQPVHGWSVLEEMNERESNINHVINNKL